MDDKEYETRLRQAEQGTAAEKRKEGELRLLQQATAAAVAHAEHAEHVGHTEQIARIAGEGSEGGGGQEEPEAPTGLEYLPRQSTAHRAVPDF
jgi:hypothetical protein